jgi:hypothetical protein
MKSSDEQDTGVDRAFRVDTAGIAQALAKQSGDFIPLEEPSPSLKNPD